VIATDAMVLRCIPYRQCNFEYGFRVATVLPFSLSLSLFPSFPLLSRCTLALNVIFPRYENAARECALQMDGISWDPISPFYTRSLSFGFTTGTTVPPRARCALSHTSEPAVTECRVRACWIKQPLAASKAGASHAKSPHVYPIRRIHK